MALFFVIALALNMVQVNKDAARCKKDFNQSGCSIYKNLGMNK